MGYLKGLQEYLDANYHLSIFDTALESRQLWEFHLHPHRMVQARIEENQVYDLVLAGDGVDRAPMPKTDVKLLYPAEQADATRPLIQTDKKVKALQLEPIIPPRKRHHIKNKTLFPLLKEREVLFFTLLEGEVIKGILGGFTRYDITVHLKGGTPVYLLRHSVYDLRDKKGRCFLKSFQESRRDWEKSEWFVSSDPGG
ncbi:MAG: hypothetical protein K9L83_04680 [Deltaproteobacteria bacterium]|nr:hypothetical protein [Deltaproteobacteria bacterium]